MKRRSFINRLAILSAGACLPGSDANAFYFNDDDPFAKRLKFVGRALEQEDYYVWCNSPIMGPDGKVHVFFSRWKAAKKMGGWINGSEIVHAISNSPEEPFSVLEAVLQPRPGFFDATTCHNPHIQKVGNQYLLFYMGNSNGKTNTKRIGLATSDSLFGPWKRPDEPLLLPGPMGSWDDHCTTNPAFVQHPNGEYWLYYKSWNTQEYETSTDPLVKGNRKYGLAIASNPLGPYQKYEGNPVIDFSARGNNAQFEDAYVWHQKNKFYMIARDMGFFSSRQGIMMKSKNGKKWSDPKIAFYETNHYFQQPPAPEYLKKYGRLERPQILMVDNKPAYLFTTSQGGRFNTSSPVIFKIEAE